MQCLFLYIMRAEILYKLKPQAQRKTNTHNLFWSELIGSFLSVTSVIRTCYHELLSLLIQSFVFGRVSSWVLLTEEEMALSRWTCFCFMWLLCFALYKIFPSVTLERLGPSRDWLKTSLVHVVLHEQVVRKGSCSQSELKEFFLC